MLLREGVRIDRFRDKHVLVLREVDLGTVIVDILVPVGADYNLYPRLQGGVTSVFNDTADAGITEEHDTSDRIDSENLDKRLENFRIEAGAVVAQEVSHHELPDHPATRLFVRNHPNKRVRAGDHPRFATNLVLRQSAGLSLAVPPLLMLERGGTVLCPVSQRFGDNTLRVHRMGLYLSFFFGCEFSVLVDNLRTDPEHPDIVEDRRGTKDHDPVSRHLKLLRNETREDR